jgi:hypothetical protein
VVTVGVYRVVTVVVAAGAGLVTVVVPVGVE